MDYAIGVATNGERLRFERWVYEAWRYNELRDECLIRALQRCVRFTIMW
jgi:hypothetical protein